MMQLMADEVVSAKISSLLPKMAETTVSAGSGGASCHQREMDVSAWVWLAP